MSVAQDVLITLLSNAEFVESVSVLPAGGIDPDDRATMNARVVRERPDLERDGDQTVLRRATLKVLSVVHATHGGIVAPGLGDNWTLAAVRGGSAVSGWMAGPAQGGMGKWEIPVTRVEVEETGGKRK